MRCKHPLPDLGEWPPLEWEQWKDTAETLHMYMQIVGKTPLALTPMQNHWWNIPLYLGSWVAGGQREWAADIMKVRIIS
jgi:hypothetical protein